MKNYFWPIVVFLIFCLLFHSCSRRIASYIPDMESSIAYESFHQQTIQFLLTEPLNLKIDTAWQNVIIASEVYDGRMHKRWFFRKIQWKEKAIYTIRYTAIPEGVLYSLNVQALEAPNENWQNWRPVQASRATKEIIIIQKLSHYEQ